MVTKEDEAAFAEWLESVHWPGDKRPKSATAEEIEAELEED